MEKILGFMGLGFLAVLMIPAAIIISALRSIFNVLDNLIEVFKRRKIWKRKNAAE